tara:strand:- start:9572 stop:10876 length:1305 start_codon:yes stop_codon:yes gene_type:complete
MPNKLNLELKGDYSIEESVNRLIDLVSNKLTKISEQRTENVSRRLEKVLKAFSKARLNPQHFLSFTGYAHGDQGRETIDRVFADILGAEKSAVRLQFVSGTHAITSALFGVLRPGDKLLSITGRPYETLEQVIGLRGKGQGSLKDFGVIYEEISLNQEGRVDLSALEKALTVPKKMIFIQRSCGYSWRPSLSIEEIKNICFLIHKSQPECICFVDNCYGEFVEEQEPTDVGADLIAGSLIKNPGGTIVPTGGYVAGRADLVELASCRLTSPGIGSKGGTGFALNRLVLQGLFLAPQMVSEALIGADLVAGVFQELGFEVQPIPGGHRADIIQAVRIGTTTGLEVVCKAFQECSPVGAYCEPVPSGMPGYENDLIMAGGTFIDGSTSEFSADAPLKLPYNLFVQGGTHRTHVKLALKHAIIGLVKAGLVELPHEI